MAGPGFGDLRVAESSGGAPDDDAKVQRVLELLPKLKDPARRARAEEFLRSHGIGRPRENFAQKMGIEDEQSVLRPGSSSVGVTLSEVADQLSGQYPEEVLSRLRSGDARAIGMLRPADQADLERLLGERRAAASAPTSHAPMADRPADLAGELDARQYERAPVTRSRTGAPKPEPTHTLPERIAAGVAQPLSGLMRGASAATGHLATIPARAIAPEGQSVVDELADSSAVSTPASIASNMMPMSLGSKVAGYAARLIPEVTAAPGIMNMGLRTLAGGGRAALAGGASGAADAAGLAVNEVQMGAPVAEAAEMVPQGALNAVPAALAMYPLFAGLQRFGRGAVDDLRRSPDLGPGVLALENVGLSTRLPLLNRDMSMRAVQSEAGPPTLFDEIMDTGRAKPGRLPFTREKFVPPEGNEIAAAQREQQATGRPAAAITGERAGKEVLGSLAMERDDMLGRHGFENQQMYGRLKGQKVSTEPVASHISDLLQRGKFDDGTALPGKVDDNRELFEQLNSVATVRWAKPGEQGIPPEAVEAFGLKVPATSARDAGGTIPPPGKKGRAAKPRGLVIEAREMTAQQLEESIAAFDQIASAARNVEKSQSEKAARGVSAALRKMREGFSVGRARPGAIAERFDVEGQTLKSDRDYARTKEAHGAEQVAFRDKLKELGLAERVEKLRPEDANQLRAVVDKIMGGDPALQKLFPNDPAAQRELRIAAAHAKFDELYGAATAGKPNVVASPSGPHGVMSLGGSARLAFDPIARGLAGANLSPEAQRGLAGSRAGRVASQVPPETVNAFLAMIGLGTEEREED